MEGRTRHAPRERVSWNDDRRKIFNQRVSVTLHVSVWVEIMPETKGVTIMPSRSTWACELKSDLKSPHRGLISSRSTWACELKCKRLGACAACRRHAPRERVSWNSLYSRNYLIHNRHAPRERVSWNSFQKMVKSNVEVTLHVSVWVEITWYK